MEGEDEEGAAAGWLEQRRREPVAVGAMVGSARRQGEEAAASG